MISAKIHAIADQKFEKELVQQFIDTFYSISSGSPVQSYLLNLSLDQGEELEIGFFNSSIIGDVTLSNGKIYSHSCLLSEITDAKFIESDNKITLQIQGKKKFDYNVVKPGSIAELESYKLKVINALESFKSINQSNLPQFETERLILKAVTKDDIPSYTKHFVDYEIIEQLAATVPWPYPENGVEWFLNQLIWPHQGKTQWMWGLFEKQNSSELIGAIHLWSKGHPENRGFWLGKKFWGKGYMTEAVKPVMNYAFNELGFEKLIFTNAVGNLKSRRVKEKTGCRLIDIKPAKFVNPKYTEHEIWELTKEEWIKYV